jgi:hypothetical protein
MMTRRTFALSGAAVGEPALLALFHVERRLAEHVAHELQSRVLRVALDRIDRLERGLQPLVLTRVRIHVFLQERRVRFELGSEEERNREHGVALCEALADTFLLGE